MLTPDTELKLLRFLNDLAAHLRQTRDVQKALAYTLRAARDYFRASHGLVAVLRPGRAEAEVLIGHPRQDGWDAAAMAAFIRNEHPALPPDTVMAPIRRRGRAWAVLALRRPPEAFEKGDGRTLTGMTAVLSEAIEQIDRERMLDVRDRIDRKIMEQLRPKDLFYQILDGLRSLTRYDHSSALLAREREPESLVLEAEQIAWTKGKSHRIGARLTLDPAERALLDAGCVYGFDRTGDGWREWGGRPAEPLARLLDYNQGAEGGGLREKCLIVAPVSGGDGFFGVLKIAGREPGSLCQWDAELVERFRSQASIAIQNSHHTESLRARMLEAEKKQAMAELARGVSHDVNNALGSILPLVQEMREDVGSGRFDATVFSQDLEQVQKSLQVCRRIFGGMLSFARSAARRTSTASLRAALDGTLAILKDGLDRRRIQLIVDFPDRLPAIAGGQSDLEQVFLNLLSNAREAMPDGGTLAVRARRRDTHVDVVIEDTGLGIPEENLPRVAEPFFTTKIEGNGLGLSICRSILWEMEGNLVIDSRPGLGTTVTFAVPIAPDAHSGEAS